MQFQTYEFLFFLAAVLALFYIVPGKLRPFLLLVSNIYFFCYAAPQAVVWLIFTIVTSYGGAIWLEKIQKNRYRRWGVSVFVVLNLSLLVFFRYFPVWGMDLASAWGLLVPLGISFYSLQAIGYLIDVARGKYPAEKNLLHFAVFVSFFPNLSSGPIERGDRFLPRLKEICGKRMVVDYDRFMIGCITILWGFFIKLVIADRAAILVDYAYGTYETLDSASLIVTAFAYSAQIFCDFVSYSYLAVGVASLMGFSLIRNFRQPYLAKGFQDFWNRWHISLSSWLRDYVYISLGGNRRGRLRRYANILITFLVSGLWHGGALQFMVWGVLHGLFQIAEDVLKRSGHRWRNEKELPLSSLWKGLYMAVTFVGVTVLWIFFRADSVGMAGGILRRIVTEWQGFRPAWGHLVQGLGRNESLIMLAGMMVLGTMEWISHRAKKEAAEWIYESPVLIRFGICLGLMGITFVFGKYGVGYDASNFIYMNF